MNSHYVGLKDPFLAEPNSKLFLLFSKYRFAALAASLLLFGASYYFIALNQSKKGNEITNQDKTALTHSAQHLSARRDDMLTSTPILFEQNSGQVQESFQYLARGFRQGIYLSASETVLTLTELTRPKAEPAKNQANKFSLPSSPKSLTHAQLRMKIIGADPAAKAKGLQPLPSQSNYFIGSDVSQWKSNVPHFGQVKFQAVYPGIDMLYYGNQRELEYDFVVAPGANPGQIHLEFEGASRLQLNDRGELVLQTQTGELRQKAPFVYQEIDGTRVAINASYSLKGNQVSFALGEYDTAQPLVIDPSVSYSSYLGGSDVEIGNAIETDAAGNAYITGVTYSPDLPVKVPVQQSLHGVGNCFIAKFSPTGQLLFNTYLGGNAEDVGFALAVDSSNNLFVTGSTDSTNFPVTSGAMQPMHKGKYDAFVLKLSANGSQLIYSTLLGGQNDELATSVAIDGSGNAYVTGQTNSTNFPTFGGWQNSLNGPSDSFIARLNANGSALLSGTLLGGRGQEIGYGIALDAQNNIYVTGITYSDNYPTRNAAQSLWGGRVDGFLTKLNNNASGLVYSTYFGGTHDDGGFGVGLDSGASAYVTGFSSSLDFPTRAALQAANGGNDDAVLAKYDADGALVFATYHGGAGADRAFDLAVDSAGNAYFAGRTDSADFPLKDALQPRLGGLALATPALAELPEQADRNQHDLVRGAGRDRRDFGMDANSPVPSLTSQLVSKTAATVRDGFLAKIATNGTLVSSTYLGGSDEDTVFGVALDKSGAAHLTGVTGSSNFPVRNAAQDRIRGLADAFVVKVVDAAGTLASVSAASYSRTLARGMIVAAFGKDFSNSVELGQTIPLPTSLAGTSVVVTDAGGSEINAPLFFVSPSQINYLMPSEAVNGSATVSVYHQGFLVSVEKIQIQNLSPGFFTSNADGTGLVSGNVLRVKANGSFVYEDLARFDPLQNKFVPLPIEMGASDDILYLVLYGTGMRNMLGAAPKVAAVGGTDAQILYVGPQGNLIGLDQANLQLPRNLAGRGEVEVRLTLDGVSANLVKVVFK